MPTSTPPTRRAPRGTQGARANDKKSPTGEDEPAGHGIGRSRGGLTTKIHQAVDGHGRPLAMVITGGQRNDGVMLAVTLEDIYVPRPHGRPRTTPDAVMADRGDTPGANRSYLRARHIKMVIPEKKNEIAARKKRGSAGRRPPTLDTEAYKGRNVMERAFNRVKQWHRLAARYDKLATTYRSAAAPHAVLQWLRV
ncbi:MAG: IS5 family transposase [Actinomyces sp.]|nr:IS5 family transposase [Actinomyces sp.]MCI1661807.1 IS5 family transposase [Actinomyces sp.]MCI1690555.1 IS5 family transposase [Actinomyces sp.]MCI1786536.1 IS5 family transposase [Actinomyces sp.]